MKLRRPFISGDIFHVFNRSIAGFRIFDNDNNKKRFVVALNYYNEKTRQSSLSLALRNKSCAYPNLLIIKEDPLVKFLAFCIMPDHYHLFIKIVADRKLSKYVGDIENGYTKYFNEKYNRQGPLWQSRFKAVKIKNNNQLLHVSRYIHLNPTTNGLVTRPEDWFYSSYREYVYNRSILSSVLPEISITTSLSYKKFVEDQIDYQKKLKKIKKLILE